MKDLQDIFLTIKREYCSLFSFKLYPYSIEVITPVPTLSSQFVSVFITKRGDSYVVTDGGWISDRTYDFELNTDDTKILELVASQYSEYYSVDESLQGSKKYYYKKINDKLLVPRLVFDMANFIAGVVNAYNIEYKPKREIIERDRFRSDMDSFMKEHYGDKFTRRKTLTEGLIFGGAVTYSNRIHLIEYVTGSSKKYFQNDLRKATINFQILQKSHIINHIGQRIAVINDSSEGSKVGTTPLLMNHFKEVLTHKPILKSNKNIILDLIAN